MLHVLPLTFRSPDLPMIALLLRAFRDFDVVRRCYKPVMLKAFLQRAMAKFSSPAAAERFSSSSPAAGLGRAIFEAPVFGSFFSSTIGGTEASFISVSLACVDGEQQQQARGKGRTPEAGPRHGAAGLRVKPERAVPVRFSQVLSRRRRA